MPDDLLSPASILARLREVLTEEVCADVEVIGWLYQFYISEKKDQVFAGLKKNQKITAENIPAATQLFTPHWIVRYLVENSLGRLWLLNRPTSKLAERMDYYIAPEEPETDFLKISKPEEIKVCDPACGSGHMLTYAFDLLYAIYEEEGYEADEIPALILANNLTGMEIDDRAGALAAFALAMKAAARLGRRRFLRMTAKPNICVFQNVKFTVQEMRDLVAVVGNDLFTKDLHDTLTQFAQAKNFGSLIEPSLSAPVETMRLVEARDLGSDLFLKNLKVRVLRALSMANALYPKYHVVIANPPYLGGKGMNPALSDFAKTKYPSGKSDLYAAFIERAHSLTLPAAYAAMVTMESWMFLSSFEGLRRHILGRSNIRTLLHMPYLGKGGTSMGINFGTCAFVLEQVDRPNYKGDFICVRHFETDDRGVPFRFPTDNERRARVSISELVQVPGEPIAYWASSNIRNAFVENAPLSMHYDARQGLATADDNRFLRLWHEVSLTEFARRDGKGDRSKQWFPFEKGGDYRKWYGNREIVINWRDDGRDIRSFERSVIRNPDTYFRDHITWTSITSGLPSFRFGGADFVISHRGPCIVSKHSSAELYNLIAYLNSAAAKAILDITSATITIEVGQVSNIPVPSIGNSMCARRLIDISKADWDAYETSWDFTMLPLLLPDQRVGMLEATYGHLRAHWQGMANEMKRLEEENNRIFIDAYGMQDELSAEVPLEEITLTCNPAYRYGGKATPEELEERLRADTMAEFLHYAVGCMFGRYSLDAPGLILANQGEGLEEYLARVPNPTFEIDADNVIPVLEGEWFADDITGRFRKFLRITFGEAKFQENLAFIETALGKDIRKWFTKDFFDYHVRRFKKRPIYWMFSSPKGSFNALIYMHRYRPDTVSIVLNDYLREFISKLQAERARLEKLSDDPAASPAQRTRALRDVATVIKQIAELEEWEREVVYPLAQAKIEIDLDDGVKRNYPKFGAALKPIKGLETADE
jgi:hypothetical protein